MNAEHTVEIWNEKEKHNSDSVLMSIGSKQPHFSIHTDFENT